MKVSYEATLVCSKEEHDILIACIHMARDHLDRDRPCDDESDIADELFHDAFDEVELSKKEILEYLIDMTTDIRIG